MKTKILAIIATMMALTCLSCTKEPEQTGEKDKPAPTEQTFTASFEDYVAVSKVALDKSDNAVKASWTGNEYILVSNGTADITISETGAISGEGAQWIEASSCTMSQDKKTLTFSTELTAGEQWYVVVTDNMTNISWLSADGDLTTNPATSSTGGTIRYIGYAKAAAGANELSFKNVMSYISFRLEDSYYAVTFEPVAETDADFCQSVCFDAEYTPSSGVGSSRVFTVLTSGNYDSFCVPVTPVGSWESGLVVKMWDKDGYDNMESALPVKSAELNPFEIAANTVVDLGMLEDLVLPSFEYKIPEKVCSIDPTLFSSLGCGSRWFQIVSTVPWTASVNEAETTASDVKIKTTSGQGSLEKFEVTVGRNEDFDNRKTIVIDFVPEGLEPVKVTLYQEKASVMTFEFGSQDLTETETAMWPFEESYPELREMEEPVSGTYTWGEYSFNYYAEYYNKWESDKQCWLFGRAGSYIDLPAIEGRKLMSVSIYDRNGSAAIAIQNAEGTDVTVSGKKDVNDDDVTSLDMAVSYNNTSYRLAVVTSSSGSKTLRIVTLTLVYAEATAADNPPAEIVPIFTCHTPEAVHVSPVLFSSLGCTPRHFSISSNVAWTASVNTEKTTASGVKISTTSGEGDLDKFEVTVGPNTDLANRKKIVIDFKPEGHEVVEVELEQEKGSIISLEFADQSYTVPVWPFAKEIGEYKTTDVFELAGYSFPFSAPGGMSLNSNGALQMGSGSDPAYIDSPAIADWRLAKVKAFDRNGNTAPQIVTVDGKSVQGGADAEMAKLKWTEWTLSGTAANTSYRYIVTNTAKTVRLSYLVFEYEAQ